MAEPFDPEALPPDAQVAVTRDGVRGTIPKAKLDEYVRHGWQPEDPEVTKHERLKQEYDNDASQQALAGAEGAASALTFGGSDLALRQLDPEGSQARAEFYPWTRGAGELGGAVLGGGVGMGGALSAAGEGAEALYTGGKAATLTTKLVGAGVRGGVEGMGYGAGAGISQVALSPDPITWEGAAATIGSNILGGAALGTGLGVAGKMLGEGALAARDHAAKQVESLTTGAEAVDRGAYPELAHLDQEGIAKARVQEVENVKARQAADITEGTAEAKAERTRLETQRTEAAKGLYQEAKAYKDSMDFVASGESETRAMLGTTKGKIMKGLNNEGDFVDEILAEGKRKGGFMSQLRTQAEALNRVLADADQVMADAPAELQKFTDELPRPRKVAFHEVAGEGTEPLNGLTPEQSKVYAQHFGVKIPEGQPGFAVTNAELGAFRDALEGGEIKLPRIQRMETAQQFLERNQQLQSKIGKIAEPVASDALKAAEDRVAVAKAGAAPTPRLKAIEAHQADLQKSSMGRTIAQGIGGALGGKLGFGVAGPIGAVSGGLVGRDIANKLYDRFVRKLVASNAARGQTIKKTIAGMFEKGAARVAAAAPSATKIIPAIRYATQEHADAVLGPAKQKPSKDKLVTETRLRIRELNAVTEHAADGSFQVRQQALEALHDRMAGVWQVSAAIANGIEKSHQLRLQYLASKVPRNPAPPYLQAGPDSWEPSHAQIAQFARIMQVAENPEIAVQRVAGGTATPDDVETLKTLYPSHYEDIRQQCMTHVAMLQHTLPYVQRLNLSLLLDIDVDPALTPEAMSVYQAPKPMPEQQTKQAPIKSLPQGMIEPTTAQRFASK